MKHEALHHKALEVVKRYKRCEVELIEVLQQVWTERTFYHFGCNSLFQYSVTKLGLSPEVTNIFNKITKKTLKVPGFLEEIKQGNITISNASRLCSVITPENKDHWFERAKQAKPNLEREIALASPKSAIKEKKTLKVYGNEVRVELTYGVSEQHLEEIKRVQDLLSQKLKRSAILEDVSEATIKLYLEKHDPLKKPCKPQKGSGRRIKVTLSRSVHHQHNSQCTHIDENGRRCQERRFLHIHHIKPLSEGGTNDLDNLTLFCSGHHRVSHL